MKDKATELNIRDCDNIIDNLIKQEIKITLCNWCNISTWIREMGPNYICEECEKKERASGRPLIFTSPVQDSYFKFE